MDPRLKKIVEGVKRESARMNPNEGDIPEVDAGWLLQLEILRDGDKYEFSEADLLAALEEIGYPEEYQHSWLESFASYI